MAQYFNDFTQYPLATKIDGGEYDFAVLAGQTDYTFEVAEDARGASGRVLRHHKLTNTGYTWWQWTAVPTASSGEIYLENIAGLSSNTGTGARVAIPRLFANANAELTQGYFGTDVAGGSSNVTPSIRRVDAPATVAAAGTFYPFETNRKRSHLLKWTDLGTSVALKYKTWWTDEAEPGAWSLETTSSTISAPYWGSGIVGFGRYESGAVEGMVAFIGVGTGTDSAPRAPLSGDTTAPTLTSPMASATGTTTASGSVSTNEANGTLYYLATANATELLATVKAGSSQAVTAINAQPVTVTGLTASTSYYLHFVHRDAAGNDSTVETSAQFTTDAPSGDTDPPTLTGSVTFSSITQTSYTANWPAGLDNVAVTGYEYQIGGTAGAWTDAGNNLSAAITGRTAGATETVYVRAYDAAGLRSTPAISGSVTLESALAAGINVTEPLKNNTGTLLANLSGVGVAVLSASDFTYGLTTNASGILSTISDAGIVAGQQYYVAIKLADGGVGITGPITAS